MAEITIDNVRKSFGALEVLHGVSAKAEDGEFVVLVGPTRRQVRAGLGHLTTATTP